MANTTQTTAVHLPVSDMAENLIGSEIIKLAAEINEKIRNGERIFDYTIGDFDPNLARSLPSSTTRYIAPLGNTIRTIPQPTECRSSGKPLRNSCATTKV